MGGEDEKGMSTESVVATAAISMDSKSLVSAGGSIGHGDSYDPTGGGASLEVVMVVTVNGRPTRTVSLGAENKVSFDGGANEGPYSIITTIFREIM